MSIMSIKMLECLSDDVKSMESSINRLTQIAEENRDGMKQKIKNSITRHSQASKDTNYQNNCSKENDEYLLQKLAKHNFKSKIRSKVKFFHPGTREWFLKEVERFFKNEYKKEYKK
ncbi:Hypothetical predicted protein [Paramuricea clavata]|uniref:Uncharacterized protein n=1 Tax=Paramuricea clavata TaxID=317549 RepID=A0A6S7HUR4_PARCT|nr:Hypothetical predicted protein [Paramuricea clavata]